MASILIKAFTLSKINKRRYDYLWFQMGKEGYRLNEPMGENIPFEKPSLLNEIFELHKKEFNYSLTDISHLTNHTENELVNNFPDIFDLKQPLTLVKNINIK